MLTIRHNELPVLALLLNPPPDAALVLAGKLYQLPQRQRVFSARMKKIRNQWISFAVCVRIRIGKSGRQTFSRCPCRCWNTGRGFLFVTHSRSPPAF